MVAVIENWADLVGRIREISDHDGNFATIAVDVEHVDDVDGYPNLLADLDHTTAHIDVRHEQLRAHKLEPGDRIRARTRRAQGDRLFAHPHHLEVLTS
jgi:hypothetical protein